MPNLKRTVTSYFRISNVAPTPVYVEVTTEHPYNLLPSQVEVVHVWHSELLEAQYNVPPTYLTRISRAEYEAAKEAPQL